MADQVYNALFLCTGNSSRSIMAEGILNKDGAGRFKAYSAGSNPNGIVNPFALKTLAGFGYPTDEFSSKRWDVFAAKDAPVMDFVFTVCDDAAGEACPVWPGTPATAHWGVEDPAKAEGTDIEKEAAFVQAFKYLKNRISLFLNLPINSLDSLALGNQIRAIGEMEGASRNARPLRRAS